MAAEVGAALAAFETRELEDALAYVALRAARGTPVGAEAQRALNGLVLRLGGFDLAPTRLAERLRRHFMETPVAPALLRVLFPERAPSPGDAFTPI